MLFSTFEQGSELESDTDQNHHRSHTFFILIHIRYKLRSFSHHFTATKVIEAGTDDKFLGDFETSTELISEAKSRLEFIGCRCGRDGDILNLLRVLGDETGVAAETTFQVDAKRGRQIERLIQTDHEGDVDEFWTIQSVRFDKRIILHVDDSLIEIFFQIIVQAVIEAVQRQHHAETGDADTEFPFQSHVGTDAGTGITIVQVRIEQSPIVIQILNFTLAKISHWERSTEEHGATGLGHGLSAKHHHGG